MFGITFDKAKGDREHQMANPWTGQRREPPKPDTILGRFFGLYPPRVARGDLRPIMGAVQAMPDGSPGGRPIPQPETLMSPLRNSGMMPTPIQSSNNERNKAERKIQATRFMAKERITLLQLDKPSAKDAALSLRWKPGVPGIGKPAPPSPYIGGFTRVWERNVAYPKDTSLSMQPISTLESRWPKMMPLASFSGVSSGTAAKFPKTL